MYRRAHRLVRFIVFSIVCTGALLSYLTNDILFAQESETSSGSFSTTEVQNYSNSELGISVEFASDWHLQEIKNGLKLQRQADSAFIELRINKLEPSFTDITQYAIEDLNSRKNNRADFKLIKSEQTIISEDIPAYSAIYSFSKTEPPVGQVEKILRFWILGENKIYTIAYVAKNSTFEAYLAEAQRIIDSVRIQGISTNSQEQDTQNLTGPSSSSTREFSSYENKTLQIKIDYPSDWDRQELNRIVRFVSPPENESDTFRETVEISVFPKDSLPFSIYPNSSIQDITNEFIKYYSQKLGNFEIVDTNATLLIDKHEAEILVLKYADIDAGETQAMNLFVTNPNDVFVISYYAQPANFDIYLPTIKEMVSSLQFLAPAT